MHGYIYVYINARERMYVCMYVCVYTLDSICSDFITTYEGEHIRGSECDQKILSKKESSGFVVSPNYPFPYIPKVVCRYFIYGMQDSQHLERVRLEFRQFKIPKNKTIGE